MADLPYTVKHVHHRHKLATDGTMGGEYEVAITHNGGVESSFAVPEGPNAAQRAHVAAMAQVDQTKAIMNLPAGATE